MDLKSRIKLLPPEEQDIFFRKAAKFFSNRELSSIIDLVGSGFSLYAAHERSGVIDRYSVDLQKLI